MSADPEDRVIVDTNVLVAATDRGRRSHVAAIRFLDEDDRRLAVTPQIVREYLAVATRPLDVNGLGLSGAHATENLEEFLADTELLPDGSSSVRRLLDMVSGGYALGKQVHDANVVAVALAHGVTTVVTDNVRDFERFADAIAVEPLGA